MKTLLSFFIGLSMGSFSAMSHAENLIQVYQHAKITNPDVRSSAALRDRTFEEINQTRSPLLPQIQLNARHNYSKGLRDANGLNSNATHSSLQLTQTLFDMSKWHALTLQEKHARIQDIIYQTEQQKLILNTAMTYFAVLKALDALSCTCAHKQAVYRQLDRTTQRFNVGLEAITDVQNARAEYDGVLAEEVSAQNALDNAREALRQVSGNIYPQLAGLNLDNFHSHTPDAVAIQINVAENHNLRLLKARLQQDEARERIRCAKSGHIPTLTLNAASDIHDDRYSGSRARAGNAKDSDIGQNKVRISVSLPLYSGGAVSSQVKQAQLGFICATEQLESTHRAVVQNTRSSFNDLSASISSITAYQQAVHSAQSLLDATQAGFQVGSRTIVDVLNATSSLYNNKQQLANARYSYLINQLKLKLALGTLGENDVQALNAILGRDVILGREVSTSPPIFRLRHPK